MHRHILYIIVIATLITPGVVRAYDTVTNPRLIQMTGDAGEQTYADVWGKTIVYIQDNPHSTDLYAHLLAAGEKRRITDSNSYPKNSSYPAIYENLVAFSAISDANLNCDIWLYDLDANSFTRVTTDPNIQQYPRMWGRYIVWSDWRQIENQTISLVPAVDFLPKQP